LIGVLVLSLFQGHLLQLLFHFLQFLLSSFSTLVGFFAILHLTAKQASGFCQLSEQSLNLDLSVWSQRDYFMIIQLLLTNDLKKTIKKTSLTLCSSFSWAPCSNMDVCNALFSALRSSRVLFILRACISLSNFSLSFLLLCTSTYNKINATLKSNDELADLLKNVFLL